MNADNEMYENRHCLPCTACCDGWLSGVIRGHRVAAGSSCPFSSPDGCSIYETRPVSPCRSYMCSWIVDDSPLPEWMRPDRCGAIVLLSLPWHGDLVISAIPAGATIPEKTLSWLKKYAQKHGLPLIFYERTIEDGNYSGLKAFGFGPPAFCRKVAKLTSSGEIPTLMSAS